ncbi:MAG TPA: cytochrome b/b6 domain-containing protein [Allosphingosinicella sp.]|nr:cytochrome b/b6 domain-containing protein [Allosphingosinicella sp.]
MATSDPLRPRRDNQPRTDTGADEIVRRHRLTTRLWHWTNALTVFVMLMSGLMIFNAHPRLYWGQYGANNDHAWLEIGSRGESGYLRIGAVTIPTTGVLGYRVEANGQANRRAFPGWATIPSNYSLSAGRRWHLAFAWVLAIGILAYWLVILANRHWRGLLPRRAELHPRHLWHEIKDHARLRFPTGAAALDYNTLQKLSYAGVIFVLLPLVILTGLTMSPGMNAAWGWLPDLFGGRQSARSIHFICAMLIAAFILVHLVMVVLAGPLNEIRSMITGWYRLPQPKPVTVPPPAPAQAAEAQP